jgi:hypothetical protein
MTMNKKDASQMIENQAPDHPKSETPLTYQCRGGIPHHVFSAANIFSSG